MIRVDNKHFEKWIESVEADLLKMDDELRKERLFYRLMDTHDISNVILYMAEHGYKYPELLDQIKYHIALTRMPKKAALTFVDNVNPALIEIEKMLCELGKDIPEGKANDLNAILRKVCALRGDIPLLT